jgi:hypothetical protein
MPSNVQEWEYFSKLPDKQKEQYLTMRRGVDTMNLGDRFAIPSQVQPGATLGEFDVGLRPGDQPAVRGAQTAAVEAAQTAALPGQLAIENQAAVERENALAVAPRSRDAEAVLGILDMAEPLLQTATESGLGTLRDNTLAFFGKSTESGEAAAQLKALGALLISKQPKMSGPQSDKDVQLYRDMAGQVGDSTVPIEQRVAAIQMLRELNEKYANQAANPAPAAPGTPARGPNVFDAADEVLRAAGIIP